VGRSPVWDVRMWGTLMVPKYDSLIIWFRHLIIMGYKPETGTDNVIYELVHHAFGRNRNDAVVKGALLDALYPNPTRATAYAHHRHAGRVDQASPSSRVTVGAPSCVLLEPIHVGGSGRRWIGGAYNPSQLSAQQCIMSRFTSTTRAILLISFGPGSASTRLPADAPSCRLGSPSSSR
jgi:fatty acid desaturase